MSLNINSAVHIRNIKTLKTAGDVVEQHIAPSVQQPGSIID